MSSIHLSKIFTFILLGLAFAFTGYAQSISQIKAGAIEAARAQQLRFSSQRPVERLRLQVHDGTGALIHDSGLVAKNSLAWEMRDQKGSPLTAGVYDWTLTIKDPGVDALRVKRGRFDLSSPGDVKSGDPSLAVAVGGSGTVGNIPIWTSATDLGDSIIVEDNGHVAIGSTPGANIRLRVYLMPDDKNAANAIQAVLQPSQDIDNITTGAAVYALSQGTKGSSFGVHAGSFSNIGIGVWGQGLHEYDPAFPAVNSRGIGVKGTTKSLEGIGVEGVAGSETGENFGVRGQSMSNTGVGVLGEISVPTGLTFGVKGLNSGQNGRGVLGHATDTTGVNYGVVGRTESPNGFAGYFIGRVHVAGFLSKAAGAFKIDHPLDPENKTLSHSFVESPEMMNIYNGIVILGKDGAAVVTLPDWFEALNREFRYQLTCIGGFSPVYVAERVSGNRFKIAGGQAGMEISWQLTGVRKDAYAETHRIQVEEMKPIAERGTYLHPDAFGKSAKKNIAVTTSAPEQSSQK